MAQTFTALPLSGAASGTLIKILATATPGTTIHTATSSTTGEGCDEVWLWAGSTSGSIVNLTLQIGSTTGIDNNSVNCRIPPAYTGPVAILAGHRVLNGTVVTATASIAERVNVWGNVNRISLQSS